MIEHSNFMNVSIKKQKNAKYPKSPIKQFLMHESLIFNLLIDGNAGNVVDMSDGIMNNRN